jgi:uncharacterized membrane protein HdeD (DUF308 family)
MPAVLKEMAHAIGGYWWLFLIRGIAAILFGILAYAQPGITLAVLVMFFGAYVMVDGIFAVIAALRLRTFDKEWWVMLLLGLVGIAVGVLTFHAPQITALALLLYIAIWAFVTGIMQVILGVRFRREIDGEFWLILSGILGIAFAILVLWNPLPGALAILWMIAAFAIVMGVTFILLAFKLRKLKTV